MMRDRMTLVRSEVHSERITILFVLRLQAAGCCARQPADMALLLRKDLSFLLPSASGLVQDSDCSPNRKRRASQVTFDSRLRPHGSAICRAPSEASEGTLVIQRKSIKDRK